MIVLTSNLGAREMSELISGGIGFAPGKGAKNPNDTEVDQKIYRTAVESARRKFSPEFMNRIDKVVVFRSLKNTTCEELDLELQAGRNVSCSQPEPSFYFRCSETAKRHVVEGRPGLQIWRPSLETVCRALSGLSAFEPRSDWSDRTGRPGANRPRRVHAQADLLEAVWRRVDT